MSHSRLAVLAALAFAACASPPPEGLREADVGTGAEVRFDVYKRPLPDIPLPNDFATRFDPSSPTKRRVNAPMTASTEWERATREELDLLDGWGTYAPISVGFSKPLDLEVFFKHHQGDDYNFADDAVFVIDVTQDSPDFCKAVPLDLGEGNFPLTLERKEYFPNDPRNNTEQLVFEEVEEDLNKNGKLDLGEDTDMDGVLDHPNFRNPFVGQFEAMTFYERETNTLLMRPVMPLRETTTYAVVITKRVVDEEGKSVRSPFRYINHTAQTGVLRPLESCLPAYGLGMSDVSFTWAFTTQSVTAPFKAIRDGLYGVGPMSRLRESYPPELSKLFDLRTAGPGVNTKIVPSEMFIEVGKELAPIVFGGGSTSGETTVASHQFIDYHVVGQFESPQFFPRKDDAGNYLPLYRQTWKVDPVTGEAFTRPETVTFWLTVPKNRNGKPAPLIIIGHGYTGFKVDPVVLGGHFARQGIATLGMEAVSHGFGLGDIEKQIAKGFFASKGLEGMYKGVLTTRAYDQDGDGIEDSAADFWTSYAFHTRDVVRQSAIDYMRAIEIFRSFDGVTRWKFDVNNDGTPDLAGDFDGDGVIDVGGPAGFHMLGGSLGGIMSTIVGGLEPAMETVIPVSGGAGLADIGVRSIQGGVAEAVNLRMMGPLLVTQIDPTTNALELWQWVPSGNEIGRIRIGAMPAVPRDGDTAVVKNLRSGEYRCARVQTNGMLRAAVSSDQNDPLRLELYEGPLAPQPTEGCSLEGATPYAAIDALGVEAEFQGQKFAAGSPLIAFGDGFGIRRASPEMRRFMGIAQTILDAADPASFAPFFENRLLTYGNGEQVRTRALVVSTIGDMNVPMATGAALARAAGFVELYKKDARYGKTVNRLLIDTGAIESVERTGRYFNSQGQPVLLDLENFAAVVPQDDGFDVPRLEPPLREIHADEKLGGFTGTVFPMSAATGKHGFGNPDPGAQWDLGSMMINMGGRYVATNGRELVVDKCHALGNCPWLPPMQ